MELLLAVRVGQSTVVYSLTVLRPRAVEIYFFFPKKKDYLINNIMIIYKKNQGKQKNKKYPKGTTKLVGNRGGGCTEG
jgi:hypothetical protein